MNRKQIVRLSASALLLIGAVAAPIHTLTAEEASKASFSRPYTLLDIMHKFQRFADKLYFAGTAKNKRLASWYLWKLEQAAFDVTSHKTEPWYPPHVDEADLVTNMLMPAIMDMEENLKTDNWNAFTDDYNALVLSCNGCHQVTQHEYVKIIVPVKPTYGNQDFSLSPE